MKTYALKNAAFMLIIMLAVLCANIVHADTFDFSYIFANGIDSVTGTVTGTQQGDSVTGTILNPVVTSVVFDGVEETASFSNYNAPLTFPQGAVSGSGVFSFSAELTDVYLEPWITYRVFYLFGDEADAGVYDTYYSLINPTTPIFAFDIGQLGTWSLVKEGSAPQIELFSEFAESPNPVPEELPVGLYIAGAVLLMGLLTALNPK